jgi:hypothetical protein
MESEENWPRNETEETNHPKKSTGWGEGQKEEEKTEEREREGEERRMREEGRWGYANRSIHGNQEILRCAF